MDIISKILYYADIDDLLNFSTIDDSFCKTLKDRYFWLLYFDEHNLQLPIENYDNAYDWINIFNKINNANAETLSIIKSLTKDKKLVVQYIKDIDQIFCIDKYLQNISMITILDRIKYLKIKYPNVDLTYQVQIRSINDTYGFTIFFIYYNKYEPILETVKKSDLYKIIYPLIFHTYFKTELF